MNKLSPEDQELVKECAAEALDWGNDYLADNEAVIIQKLKDGGTVITELTEEQKAEFRRPAPESMMIMQNLWDRM